MTNGVGNHPSLSAAEGRPGAIVVLHKTMAIFLFKFVHFVY